MQMKFFGDEGRRLVDDGSGCITYRPHFLDETEAQRAFQALRSSVVWHRERRLMYDREVEVPRLTAHYRLGALMPGPLPELFVRVREAASAPFNSVGLNLYRDERDSVAPHNDHLSEIAPRYPIALVSLGETRLMTIRSKERPRRAFDIDLEPGSLLTMSYETQRAYDHGIPKQRRRMGSRMSVVFRVRPED